MRKNTDQKNLKYGHFLRSVEVRGKGSKKGIANVIFHKYLSLCPVGADMLKTNDKHQRCKTSNKHVNIIIFAESSFLFV